MCFIDLIGPLLSNSNQPKIPPSGPFVISMAIWFYDLQISNDENWVLMGDFNFMRSCENRNRPGGNAEDMRLFNDIIRVLELIEIPIKGMNFTWSNMQDSPLLEQLDWVFTSSSWTDIYPIRQLKLQHVLSQIMFHIC